MPKREKPLKSPAREDSCAAQPSRFPVSLSKVSSEPNAFICVSTPECLTYPRWYIHNEYNSNSNNSNERVSGSCGQKWDIHFTPLSDQGKRESEIFSHSHESRRNIYFIVQFCGIPMF